MLRDFSMPAYDSNQAWTLHMANGSAQPCTGWKCWRISNTVLSELDVLIPRLALFSTPENAGGLSYLHGKVLEVPIALQ